MGKSGRVGLLLCSILLCAVHYTYCQDPCTSADILDPGFKFITPSRGCAPFTVQLQTEYLSSNAGTTYFVDWGDGTPEETYYQTSTEGVIIQHTFPNSPVECGYDIIIDAENACNPRGSVTPTETQVLVWTNDIISINPQVFRVCQGFAQELQFTDDSDWNCYPRDTRENDESRWIQWIYGTGDASNRISDISIDNVSTASYPYNDPDPDYRPFYPVTSPGQASLPISVPLTNVTDIGKEFEVTLRNWNQCNPYDNDVKDGNGRNPVGGDISNGDNDPVTTTARIVIVPAPEPEFQTRAGGSSGPLQTTFCVDDDIYFENITPSIEGSGFFYTWEFFDDGEGTGEPISTSAEEYPTFRFSNSGVKLIRLRVRDGNAVGDCEEVYEMQVFISPLLQARIGVWDTNDNPIEPEFCQAADGSATFTLRFSDESVGTVTSDTRWRWEFYNENQELISSEPSDDGYSSSSTGLFDMEYTKVGEYNVKLIVLDNATGCISEDLVKVKVNPSPVASFNYSNGCEGDSTTFEDLSTAASGDNISFRSYDIFNNGTTDTSLNSALSWKYKFDTPGAFPVELKVVSEIGCADSVVHNIVVEPLPEANITANQFSGCSELEVVLENESWEQSLPVDYYQWEVNKGGGFVMDTIQRPSDPDVNGSYSRIFTNTGSTDLMYQVRMIAVGLNGCARISDTLEITVTPGAFSGFLFTNYSPYNNNCSPQEISFEVDQETRELNPENYFWEVAIGDSIIRKESTGTSPSFTHTFINETSTAKEFIITLSTELNSSCSADSTLFVKINPIPSAEFFIDTVSMDCDHVRLKFESVQKGLSFYRWRLEAEGNLVYANEDTQESFEFHFDRGSSPVNLSASLLTKNLANCFSEEVIKAAVVNPAGNLTAAFSATPNQVSLPDATIRIENQSTPGDWEYYWHFGDGQSSNDPNISSHTYSEPGNYVIELKISDDYCESTFTRNITVASPPPTANFDYAGEAGCLPHEVQFNNMSSYGREYLWDFGDGGISTLEQPKHTYTQAGIYSVRLTVTGFNGEEDSYFMESIIEVFEQPLAFFEVRPELVYIHDMPIYTRNLSAGATSYYWDFGDGTVSNVFEPKHIYEQPGQFDITLVAYNQHCSDSLTIHGAVTAKQTGRVLVPNAFSPNRSGPGSIGSGENDVFIPVMSDVSGYQLQVFNRWGELLFEGQNKGWDGYYRGRLCPQDVYVYRLELVFNNGEKATRVGDVNLIR